MSTKRPTRRAFLGTCALAGAGAIATRSLHDGPGLSWCRRPAHPMARKTCWLVTGADTAHDVGLALWVLGPFMTQPEALWEGTRRVDGAPTPLSFELSYPHEELQPGAWRYHVTAEFNGSRLTSDAATYSLRQFRFGV